MNRLGVLDAFFAPLIFFASAARLLCVAATPQEPPLEDLASYSASMRDLPAAPLLDKKRHRRRSASSSSCLSCFRGPPPPPSMLQEALAAGPPRRPAAVRPPLSPRPPAASSSSRRLSPPSDDLATLISVAKDVGFNFWDFDSTTAVRLEAVCRRSAIVYCDETNSVVIGLALNEHPDLWGIPLVSLAGLSRLESLMYLEAAGNGFTGVLPDIWGAEMKELVYLDLWPNALTGNLPSSWSGMSNIVDLYLAENQLEGELPDSWSALSNLDYINLRANTLQGRLPAAWSALQNLRILDMQANRLEGELPSGWSALVNLEELYLSNNNLGGTLPQAFGLGLDSLKELTLSSNNFEGPLPETWGNLVNLEQLQLQSNMLDGRLPIAWTSMVSLTFLNLAGNKLSGELPGEYSALSGLIFLDLSYNMLEGQIPTSWGALVELKELFLSGNLFRGRLPDEFSALVNLERLSLVECKLEGDLPRSWSALTSLLLLELHSNALGGPLPREWCEMVSLTSLSLAYNMLEGGLPGEWSSLVNLVDLNLKWNSLEGNLPSQWSSLVDLEALDLSGNRLDGVVPPEFSRFKSLASFLVEANALTGGIEHLVAIPTLRQLDVSDNNLIGSFSFIKNAGDNLAKLDLSTNRFDLNVVPADFVLVSESREKPLLVDLREMTFRCPFPTADSISLASLASGFSTPRVTIIHEPCDSSYGVFLLKYCLPFLGALAGCYLLWKVLSRYRHVVEKQTSKKMKELFVEGVSMSRKSFRLALFVFLLYDNINDFTNYKNMLDVVDSTSFDNPCTAMNDRDIFYPSTLRWIVPNRDPDMTFFPDFICDINMQHCEETGFATFSEYLYYFYLREALIGNKTREDNVAHFAMFCEDFYVAGAVPQCSYSGTKGNEGCVRVRNMQREKNQRFKPYIVASLSVICLKEFVKFLLVIYVWLCASTRELGPCELGLIGESPFLLLLVWRRPSFVKELLLAPTNFSSLLAVSLSEDVCHCINLLAVIVYFAVNVDQQGIEYNIMFSIASSAMFLIATLRAGLKEWLRERRSLAKVQP